MIMKELEKSSLCVKDNLFLGNKNEKRIRRAIIATISCVPELGKYNFVESLSEKSYCWQTY